VDIYHRQKGQPPPDTGIFFGSLRAYTAVPGRSKGSRRFLLSHAPEAWAGLNEWSVITTDSACRPSATPTRPTPQPHVAFSRDSPPDTLPPI